MKSVPLGQLLLPRGYIRGPFGSSLVRRELKESGIPVYEQQHAISGSREFRFYISEEKHRELMRFSTQPNALIISCSGTIGRVSIIKESDPKGIISQALLMLRPNNDVILSKYLYYFLLTTSGQQALLNASHGSVQTNIASRSIVEAIRVPLPNLNEQYRIVEILSDIDDKIELNRHMNATLEEITRAVFKSWFVDFEPFGGIMPEDWQILPLDTAANFLNGLALQKYPAIGSDYLPVIKIAELKKGVTLGTDRATPDIPIEYVVEDGDFLFSWSGSLEAVIWMGGRGALNQHLFKVTPRQFPQWFVYQWVREHLPDFREIAAGKATTMGHIQRRHLAVPIVVPSKDDMLKIDAIMQPLHKLWIANESENRTLAKLHEALLPKLISGEIPVAGVNEEYKVDAGKNC